MILFCITALPAQAFLEEHMAKVHAALDAGEPVNCDRCNLSYANLSELDLTGSSFVDAYLYGARLRGTIMRDATLDRIDLTRTDLREADFSGASMPDIRSTSARWCGTTMPDGSVNDSRCE
jgi:uncharacterized protein YjbI with pentapeptide repeats